MCKYVGRLSRSLNGLDLQLDPVDDAALLAGRRHDFTLAVYYSLAAHI